MVVPTSVDAQFRRLDKHLRELEQVGSGETSEDESIIVAEICNSCILALDKAMNAIWKAKACRKEGKGKPKIYFPIAMGSREKLTEKFQQYQMPNMEKDNPEIFELVDSIQLYKGVKWLSALHKLAAIRHEDYPTINKENNGGIGFGKGQDLFLESLTIDGNGNIDIKGHGINRKSGKVEPVTVELMEEVRSVLEGVGEEPYKFCSSSVVKVKRLISDLYMFLPKHR
jgi:hypothetical protein